MAGIGFGQTPRAFGRSKPVRIGIATAVALGAMVIGLPALRHSTASLPSSENQAVSTPPGAFLATETQWSALKMAPVGQMTFRTQEDTDGKIAINDDTTTPVFSPYSGRVTRILAKAGDHLAKGDPMLAIEASEFVQAQNDLVAALATLTTARAQLTLSETAEKRQHDLYEARGGALKDWQQAQLDLANARGGYRTAEIAAAAVRNRLRILGKSERDIAALEAAPDGRIMGLETIMPAPIAGVVTQRQVGVGQYINSAATGGQTPIFAIGDLSTVWMVANVREADAARVRIGNPVEVRVLAYPGRVFSATITFVAPSIDPNTRRLTVRAEVRNADGALKPEMFGSFRIVSGDERAAPAVPEEAVIYEADTARVWVAHPDRSIELRQIRTGRGNDGLVEVLSGLAAGETVVTRGALFIDRAVKSD